MGYCPLVAQCLPHHSFLTKQFPKTHSAIQPIGTPSTFYIVRYLVSQLLDVAIFVVLQPNILPCSWYLSCRISKFSKLKFTHFGIAVVYVHIVTGYPLLFSASDLDGEGQTLKPHYAKGCFKGCTYCCKVQAVADYIIKMVESNRNIMKSQSI